MWVLGLIKSHQKNYASELKHLKYKMYEYLNKINKKSLTSNDSTVVQFLRQFLQFAIFLGHI